MATAVAGEVSFTCRTREHVNNSPEPSLGQSRGNAVYYSPPRATISQVPKTERADQTTHWNMDWFKWLRGKTSNVETRYSV
jgi:hypothetical protein